MLGMVEGMVLGVLEGRIEGQGELGIGVGAGVGVGLLGVPPPRSWKIMFNSCFMSSRNPLSSPPKKPLFPSLR